MSVSVREREKERERQRDRETEREGWGARGSITGKALTGGPLFWTGAASRQEQVSVLRTHFSRDFSFC